MSRFAIATAAAQTVTDAHMCGLGGFGTATCAAGGRVWHLAFHARTGARATPDMWAVDCRDPLELGGYAQFDDHRANLGHRSVGTPGTVAFRSRTMPMNGARGQWPSGMCMSSERAWAPQVKQT